LNRILSASFVALLFTSCATRQPKTSTSEREIEVLIERIKENSRDGYYGGLARQQMERLLLLTSPRYQGNFDKRSEEQIKHLLERIRESQRDDAENELDDRERELPAED
jgi:hypothetical protein